MKRILTIILSLLPALAAGQAPSPEEKTPARGGQVDYSLQECLAIGLRQNFDIRIVRNLQTVSDNNATLGNAGFLPSLDLSAGYSGTHYNLEQKLASDNSTVKKDGVDNSALNAGVNLSLTLFDGFSVQTNYRRLQELKLMGELDTRAAVEDFIYAFAAEYYNYIRQYNRMENLRSTVRLSRERVRSDSVGYSIGTRSGLDLQQARVDLNTDRSRLIQQNEVMHSMRTLLNQMLGFQDVEFPLSVADSTIVFNPDLWLKDIASSMMTNNVTLQLVRKDGDLSRLDLKTVQSASYPYLRANGGYGYNENWYGTGTYSGQNTLGFNYGVTLGVRLFDGMNQHRKIRNARIGIENSDLSIEKTEQTMRKNLSDNWMAYQNNMGLVELEKSNLETARLYYETARYRYSLGQLSGLELREAQNSLLDAEERLIQAQFDTKLCELYLVRLSGRIIEYTR